MDTEACRSVHLWTGLTKEHILLVSLSFLSGHSTTDACFVRSLALFGKVTLKSISMLAIFFFFFFSNLCIFYKLPWNERRVWVKPGIAWTGNPTALPKLHLGH